MIRTKEELAKEEYNRRMAENDKAGLLGRRGVFPMYHRLFYQYLRWVLAELSPYASPLPLHWSQGEDYDRHVSYFGKPWGLHNVDRHLVELLGKHFTRIFGREATIKNYRYVAKIIAKTKLDPKHIPVTMLRASVWLNEKIAQLKPDSIEAVGNAEMLAAEAAKLDNQLPQAEKTPYSPWAPLLRGGLSLPAFYSFLEECGLLAADGSLTPLGSGSGLGKANKAPWVGTLQALMEAKLLDSNGEAICRALVESAGKIQVKLAPNTLRNPSDKSSGYQQIAVAIIVARGLVR